MLQTKFNKTTWLTSSWICPHIAPEREEVLVNMLLFHIAVETLLEELITDWRNLLLKPQISILTINGIMTIDMNDWTNGSMNGLLDAGLLD